MALDGRIEESAELILVVEQHVEFSYGRHAPVMVSLDVEPGAIGFRLIECILPRRIKRRCVHLTLSGTYDSGVLKMTGSRGVEYRLTATLRGGQLEGVLEVPPLRFSFQATRVPGQNREKP